MWATPPHPQRVFMQQRRIRLSPRKERRHDGNDQAGACGHGARPGQVRRLAAQATRFYDSRPRPVGGGVGHASSTDASMSSTEATLVARVAQNWRGRGETMRWVYVTGRRAANVWRHGDRRRLAAGVLPSAEFALSEALGYRVLPPRTLPEATEVVADAQALLGRAEAKLAERRGKKGAKQFLINLLGPGDLSLDTPLLRLGRCCMKTLCGGLTSRDPPQEPHYRDEVEGPSHVQDEVPRCELAGL